MSTYLLNRILEVPTTKHDFILLKQFNRSNVKIEISYREISEKYSVFLVQITNTFSIISSLKKIEYW